MAEFAIQELFRNAHALVAAVVFRHATMTALDRTPGEDKGRPHVEPISKSGIALGIQWLQSRFHSQGIRHEARSEDPKAEFGSNPL